MRRALRLAERGWGRVHPNPMVGALVVRSGRVLAEGWHGEYGGPHAEAHALAAAGEAARGAELYVTLEPCNHHGRTPPCTGAVLAAGISRVVLAAADPNPLAGGGAERLRAAGVEVVEGVCAPEARALNAPFFHWHEQGTPFVALKLALSADGAIALPGGARTLVTSDAARAEANRLRAGFDAVMVGAGTVAADDPLLTVRGHPVRVPPLRVVLDGSARTSPGSRLLRTAAEAPVLILTAGDVVPERTAALHAAGAATLPVASDGTRLELDAVFAALSARGVRSVFAEGGAELARSLLAAGRVHRLYLFIAPKSFGAAGLRVFDRWPLPLDENWRLTAERTVGEDTLLVLDA